MQPLELTVSQGVEDAQLLTVAHARAGDRDAFERLVLAKVQAAFRMASAILGSEPDARDATQNAFLAAWTQLPKLRDLASFDAWFQRILVNACRDIQRGRQRIREIELTDEGAARPDHVDEVIDDLALTRAFELLSVAERWLLVAHHLDHRPVSAIAAALGIPVGTAKSRLHNARHALERALERQR